MIAGGRCSLRNTGHRLTLSAYGLAALKCVVLIAALLVAVQGLALIASAGASWTLVLAGALIAALAGALAWLAVWVR